MAHYARTILLLAAMTTANAYWLMGVENFITTERIDPIVTPGKISGHAHSVLGGSNFRMNTNTTELRKSECTSIPIPEDKSNYWFPHLYFQWSNSSFSSLNGGAVIYYLFSDKPGATTAFPDDFRMLSGDPTLRTYDSNSYAQQAVTFLCLDFDGVTTRHNSLPAKRCPSGVRAQINFPACWDGKNLDSPDHKSHVAFFSGGPDSGACTDPKYPITLPRIFLEVYWNTRDFDKFASQAKNTSQPYVYAYGDPTGYGYHADFLNGWDKGVLQRAVDNCNCDIYGDPTCCVNRGIFRMNKGKPCRITKSIDEPTTGTLDKLPGNNPVQKEGIKATMFADPNQPTLLSPVYVYMGDTPTVVGKPIPPGSGGPTSPIISPSSSGSDASSTSMSASLSNSSSTFSSTCSVVPLSSSGDLASLSSTASSSLAVTITSRVIPPASSYPSSSTGQSNFPVSHAPHTTTPAYSPEPFDDCEDQDNDVGEYTPTPPPQSPTTPTQPVPTVSRTPTANIPLPPSSDAVSSSPKPHSDSRPPAPVSPSYHNSTPPKPPAAPIHFPPFMPNSNAPVCPGGKFRHKLLQKAAQRQKPHSARSLHDTRYRFMKPHAHARRVF